MAKTTTPATTERHTTVSGRPIKALYTADDLADAVEDVRTGHGLACLTLW